MTPHRSALVGRDDALGRLSTAIGRLADGCGGGIWVEAGPGLGKTELLAHALARVPPSIEVRRTPAAPVTERPLLLVVDDLHRADEAVLAAWARLHPVTRTAALLLVTATRPVCRPEFDTARAGAVAGAADVVRLAPLTDADATELAHGLGLDPYVVESAVRDAGGNPAYLRLLRHGRADPPSRLRALVADHLSTLRRRTREILTLLALAPAGITATELAVRADRPPPEVHAALHEAVDGAILAAYDGVAHFRHPIVRRVLRMPARFSGANN